MSLPSRGTSPITASDHLTVKPSEQPQRRRRGMLLTPTGGQRLETAIQRSATQPGLKPYTLQELSDLTGLSHNTLMRVRSRKVPVDQQTLEILFRGLNLLLTPEDFTHPYDSNLGEGGHCPWQGGQLPLNSPLYVYRPPIEGFGNEALLQPGTTLWIKGPRQMGKTSLTARLLAQAKSQQHQTVICSLQLADTSVFADPQRFFQWFCAIVAHSLGLSNYPALGWDDYFGQVYNCTKYFEDCVLSAINTPLVLALDEMDILFTNPVIADSFFGMIRAWSEKAHYGDSRSALWQKLRLILIYSTEVDLPLDLEHLYSFGLTLELPTFTLTQIQDLAQRYCIEHPQSVAELLLDLVGGNPYLVQLGLYTLSTQQITLQQLTHSAIANDSLYSNHLRNRLWHLRKDPELLNAFKQVVLASTPVTLNPIQAHRLQSQGLVKLSRQQVVPSSRLYQQYFAQILSMV